MPDPPDECAASAPSGAVPPPHGNGHSALATYPRHRRAEFTPSRFVTESTAVSWYAERLSQFDDLAPADTPAHDGFAHADSVSTGIVASIWEARVAGSDEIPRDNPDHAVAENDSQRIGRGQHRRRVPKPGGRAIAASVAVGAFLSAAASSQDAPDDHVSFSASSSDQPAVVASTAADTPVEPPRILQMPDLGIDKLAQQLTDQLAEGRSREIERAAREAEARRPLTLVPVSGTLTSNFGARWGTTHYGLDIANAIGTPIVSVTDGEVIESGPAQGFGLWIRVKQDDGTIGVYGHIDETLVTAGQRVKAGELIATVGNRGQSTGPHLHYEVWQADGAKSDPMAWLAARGVDVT
ncbi:hypothetical protein CH263_06190 [Rhodococcus sp. 06-1059B-a]|nr:hypothetical protein CH263_06190 [Rhodococcus sp. 06-1059B-a]